MANRTRTVVYIGFTNDPRRRVGEHREGRYPGFSAKYRTHRLVFFEHFRFVYEAIDFEKRIKKWRRSKKNALIAEMNPEWNDLAVSRLGFDPVVDRPL